MRNYEPNMSDEHFLSIIEGEAFAQGTRRTAHRVIGDPDVIVKQMRHPYPGSNFTEHLIWVAVSETDLQSIFGRCLSISVSGKFLMMERLDDITKSDWADIPALPDWVTDPKPENFGILNSQIKVRDYDTLKFDRLIMLEPRLQPGFAANAKMNRALGRSTNSRGD